MMTAVKEVSFEDEYQKLQEKVALGDKVAESKRKVEEQKAILQEKKAELAQDDKKLEELRDDVKRSAVKRAELQEAHKHLTFEWNAKNNKAQSILFESFPKDEKTEARSNQKIEDIKEKLKLAQENARLFEQRLQIEEHAIVIQTKNVQIQELEDGILLKDIAFTLMEGELSIKEADYQAAIQQWSQKSDESPAGNVLALAVSSRISDLELIIENNNRDIKSRDEKIDSLERTIETKKKSPSSEIQTKRQISAAVESYRALAVVGAHIRNRKLEWEKIKQDENIVHLGNMAAHQGSVLADTILYHGISPVRRIDEETYNKMYGVNPAFVWSNKRSTKLLNILDWRGGMKDFCSHSYLRCPYESTEFHANFLAILRIGAAWKDQEFETFLGENEDGKILYATMKRSFDIKMAIHKKHLKEKRDR